MHPPPPATARASAYFPCHLALLGCGAADAEPGGFVVRDSAAITLLESAEPAWSAEEAWRVGERPIVDIGSLDGPPEYQLYRVADAARLPDGRIVVANRGSGQLRLFDADGTFLRAIGKEGDGPGEFRGLSAVWPYRADSILAWDSRHIRLTVFGPAGEYGRDLSVALQAGWPEIVGPLPDGSFLLQAGSRAAAGSEGSRQERSMTLLHLSPEGAPLDTLGEFPHNTTVTRSRGNVTMMAPPRFAPWTRVAATDSGAWVATGRRPAVDLATTSGLARSVRWRAQPQPITQDAIEAYEAGLLERAEAGARDRLREQLEWGDYAAENAYSRWVELDGEGNLWVMRAPGPLDEGPYTWLVFSPSGRLLGEVAVPRDFGVQQIGSDWILAVRRDELDVEHVQLLPLVKPRG